MNKAQPTRTEQVFSILEMDIVSDIEYGQKYNKCAGYIAADVMRKVRRECFTLVEAVALRAELEQVCQERDALTGCIESWKKEELVWRQSDHEHRIKQQQMQAGAEELLAETARLREALEKLVDVAVRNDGYVNTGSEKAYKTAIAEARKALEGE